MQTGFYVRQKADNASQQDLVRTDVPTIKKIAELPFFREASDKSNDLSPYITIHPLAEKDQYILMLHDGKEVSSIATLRDYGGNIDDDLWFKFLTNWSSYKFHMGDFYD